MTRRRIEEEKKVRGRGENEFINDSSIDACIQPVPRRPLRTSSSRASEHVFENSRLRSLLKFHATWSFTLFLGKIYRFERGEDGDTSTPTAGTETNEGIKTVVENVKSYYSAKDFEVKSSFVYKLDYDEQSKIYRTNNKKENVNEAT